MPQRRAILNTDTKATFTTDRAVIIIVSVDIYILVIKEEPRKLAFRSRGNVWILGESYCFPGISTRVTYQPITICEKKTAIGQSGIRTHGLWLRRTWELPVPLRQFCHIKYIIVDYTKCFFLSFWLIITTPTATVHFPVWSFSQTLIRSDTRRYTYYT